MSHDVYSNPPFTSVEKAVYLKTLNLLALKQDSWLLKGYGDARVEPVVTSALCSRPTAIRVDNIKSYVTRMHKLI